MSPSLNSIVADDTAISKTFLDTKSSFGHFFQIALGFGSYHKNIFDKAQMVSGFVFNERIDVSLFELWYEYICVWRGPYCSHSTDFDLKVNFWVKSKLLSVAISLKNVVITFMATVFFVKLSCLCIMYYQHKKLQNFLVFVMSKS